MLIIALIVRKNVDFFPNLFGFDSSNNSLSNTTSRNEATQAELVMAHEMSFQKTTSPGNCLNSLVRHMSSSK